MSNMCYNIGIVKLFSNIKYMKNILIVFALGIMGVTSIGLILVGLYLAISSTGRPQLLGGSAFVILGMMSFFLFEDLWGILKQN